LNAICQKIKEVTQMLLHKQIALFIFFAFPALAQSQVTDLPAGPYGGEFRDESTGKVWLDIDAMTGQLDQKLAALSSSPFRLATFADIQPLMETSIIQNAAIGPYLPCFFGGENHPVTCKYSIFDDSATGSIPAQPGIAGTTMEATTEVLIQNDAVDNVGAALYGTWAVQRAPALRPNSDPRSADFDGDGIDEKIVWRSGTGTWFVRFSASNEVLQEQWGLPGDIPLVGDYDGDHIPDLVIWRPSNGTWYVKSSSTLFDGNHPVVQQFGLPGDVPMRADFDNDGILDYAVWRPSEGNWYVLKSTTHQTVVEQWGLPGDVPVTGGRPLQ
jgi:hypothetical protein